MKNYLFVLALALPMVFVSCGDDGPEEPTSTWLKAEVSFDQPGSDGKGPEGDAFLFSLKNKFPRDLKPRVVNLYGTPVCYLFDVNGEEIFHDYYYELYPSKDSQTGKYENKSICVFFSENILAFDKDEEYLLVLSFFCPETRQQNQDGSYNRTGGRTIAYKKVKFQGNKHIYRHTFPYAPIVPYDPSLPFQTTTVWTPW